MREASSSMLGLGGVVDPDNKNVISTPQMKVSTSKDDLASLTSQSNQNNNKERRNFPILRRTMSDSTNKSTCLTTEEEDEPRARHSFSPTRTGRNVPAGSRSRSPKQYKSKTTDGSGRNSKSPLRNGRGGGNHGPLRRSESTGRMAIRRVATAFVEAGNASFRVVAEAGTLAKNATFDVGNAVVHSGKVIVDGTAHAVVGGSKAVVGAGTVVGNTVVQGGKVIVDGTAQAVVGGSKAVVGAGTVVGNTVVQGGRVIVDGTAQAVVGGSKAVVGAGTVVGNTVVQGGKVIVDGTAQVVVGSAHAVRDAGVSVVHGGEVMGRNISQVVVGGSQAILRDTANTVADGSKAIVDGSKAIVDGTACAVVGTTRVVGHGSMKVFKRTKGLVNSVNQNLKRMSMMPGIEQKKSKWEEGLEVIDSLLDPNCDIFQMMSPDQRKKLAGVKKMLLKAPSGKNDRTQHVPIELIKMQSEHHRNMSMGVSSNDEPSLGSYALDEATLCSEAQQSFHRSNFILQEYAGIKQNTPLLGALSEKSDKDCIDVSTAFSTDDSDGFSMADDSDDMPLLGEAAAAAAAAAALPSVWGPKPTCRTFVPPEFSNLSREAQQKVFDMLKWESIGNWDFNVFDLNEATGGKPMLFLGWAVLGAPYAQRAMAIELGVESSIESGYNFLDELDIPPEKLCNFVRTIEEDYSASNDYHNCIHGADVFQSLHTLIQKAKAEDFLSQCTKIQLFSVLLAAICHDVCHPGTTNAFHIKLHSELAVLYNDTSVLENFHVALSFSRMLGIDLTGALIHQTENDHLQTKKPGDYRTVPNNLLCNTSSDEFNTIRKLVIDAILHTDMSNHFQMVNDARGMLIEQEEELDGPFEKDEDVAWRMLKFMLHMADISGQAKGEILSQQWTERCMNEFFAQGDRETSLGMPVSPNCDRNTVVVADSQSGFIRFVVKPAFEVLGEYVPFVRDSVLPIIDDNLIRYLEEQDLGSGHSSEEEKGLEALPKSSPEATPKIEKAILSLPIVEKVDPLMTDSSRRPLPALPTAGLVLQPAA